MKVLYLDQGDFLSGAEIFSLDVIRALKRRKNLKIIVATNNPRSQFASRVRELKIKIIITPLPKLPPFHLIDFIRAIIHLRKLIKKISPDIIHTNTNRAHLIASSALFFSKTPKLTWMLHDFDFPHWALRLFARAPSSIGALPAVLSETAKTIPKYKSKLIPVVNGLDPRVVGQTRPLDLDTQFNLRKDTIKIGFVGMITPWKGVEIFVRAALQTASQFPNVDFFIAGEAHDQRYFKRLQKLCENSPFGYRIHFLGWIDDNLRFFASCDIYAHTSIKPEPFGRVVVEGLALGAATIASSLGGPREIIQNNETGILIPPNNCAYLSAAFQKLITEPKTRKRLVFRAQKEALQKFRTSEVARSIYQMWANTLQS